MPKLPYETISHMLNRSDIEYLWRILHTIETEQELRYRFIPDEVLPSHQSNFIRVEHKLSTILRWFDPKAKLQVIERPKIPLKSSRFSPPKPRRKSK